MIPLFLRSIKTFNPLTCNIFFSAAGNAFSQAARLHLQMQSKHDAATNFIDAGNAFKKADPQGNHYSSPPLGYMTAAVIPVLQAAVLVPVDHVHEASVI